MTNHLRSEIELLKKRILSISAMVEESLANAVEALRTRDVALAQTVIKNDKEIDQREVQVEEECLKVLALHQPVAVDLRYIVSVLKINSDLERIGDLAVNIAQRAEIMGNQNLVPVPEQIMRMAGSTQKMVKWSIDALIEFDDGVAREVLAADDEVDHIYANMYIIVEEGIRSDIEHLDYWIHYLALSRYLERIADHATNIAEDVLYMVEGGISRHKG
ncbi:MAG: phosphate signaling complex protein PhoU [Candidatus Marinimicrobia bacterium]|nr:phosphate signaling complex protein PhoU [Candidatus Neomarinimicrobiota bacterium]